MNRLSLLRSELLRNVDAAFLITALASSACSSPKADSSSSGGAASAGGGAASGGAARGGATGTGASAAQTSGGSPLTSGGSSSGGTTPLASGGVATGGSGGSAGSAQSQGGAGLGGAGTSGLGGSNPAAGGAAGAGASGGTASGGSNPGGGSAMGGAAGASSGAGGSGTGGASGAASDITCPAGATFCSGFEGTALPSGTKFHAVGPSADNAYVFDSAQAFAGKQSLSIPTYSGGFYYRALAVPVPGQNFWVRLYLRVSRTFGDDGHDSLFGASDGDLDADVNNEALVEFSEQFNEVLLNSDDQLFNPDGATTLEANKWFCVEAHYDGASGDVQVFADGKEIIHASGYAKRTYKSFRIGYMQYHDSRSVWFDDVIVAPSRINCK